MTNRPWQKPPVKISIPVMEIPEWQLAYSDDLPERNIQTREKQFEEKDDQIYTPPLPKLMKKKEGCLQEIFCLKIISQKLWRLLENHVSSI